MTTTSEALIATLISLSVAATLGFFAFRAYRRTGNAGFLLIALALAIVPQISGLVDGPIFEWWRDRFGGDRSLGESLRLYHTVRLTLTASLLSAGLLMLSRRRSSPPAQGSQS